MSEMNKTKPAMVTGANGYVASWLVKRLLEEGITVHAAVRNPDNDEKVGHLKALAAKSSGELKLFAADLLKKGSYKEAMEGCEVVFHTASPFVVDVQNPQKDLIEPAENGTQYILETANEVSSVKRVVLTSSCAAIFTDAIDCSKAPNGVLTEDIWNTTASIDYQPYSYSKTLAEKKAWELAGARPKDHSGWQLVTINPSLVMGPPLNPKHTTSESMNILKMIGDGTMKAGIPKMGMGLVDVRDVAEAHFQAGYHANASGRYITSAHNTNFLEMSLALQEKYGERFPLPKRALPKWLLVLVGPIVNKLFSRKYIRNNVNVPFKADHSKIKNELGIEFRPMKETMEETFQALIDAGVLKAK